MNSIAALPICFMKTARLIGADDDHSATHSLHQPPGLHPYGGDQPLLELIDAAQTQFLTE